jgi:hypothetical protein
MEEASPLLTDGRIKTTLSTRAAASTGSERRLCALRREHGHHVVTRLLAGGVGPSDWGAQLKPFWAADWWAQHSYK